MAESLTSTESRIALAWEIRRSDPERSRAEARDLIAGAASSGDAESEAMARVVEIFHQSLAGNPPRSILDECARLAPAVAAMPIWSARLESLTAQAHHSVGAYTAALECYQRALVLARQTGDREAMADALAGAGLLHFTLLDYPLALQELQEGLAIREELGDQTGSAHALGSIGLVHYGLGDYSKALEYHERSLEILERSGNRMGIARAVTNIGNVHLAVGEFAEALESYNRSLAINQELGARASVANILNNMGRAHKNVGSYPQALNYYQQSLAIREEIGDRKLVASSLNNIGNVHHALGAFPEALEYLQQALAIQRMGEDRLGSARTLNNIGNLHNGLGAQAEALEHYRGALDQFEEIGDRPGAAAALINIGNIHEQLGAFADALEHYQRALGIARHIGDRANVATSLNDIGNVHHALGEHSRALEYHRESLAIREEIGAREGVIDAMIGIARAMTGLDMQRAAITELNAALEGALELGIRRAAADAHLALVPAHESLGEHQSALEHMREHLRIGREIQNEDVQKQLHQLEMKKEIEIERLRNVELKDALDRLQEAHHELKQTQAQLVHSEKMASLGQLTAGIAHEINNPINYVSGSLPSVLRDLDQLTVSMVARAGCEEDVAETIEEMRGLLNTSREDARRISEVIAGFRSFTRLDENERKAVDLHAGLDATLTLLGSRLGGRIEVIRDYGAIPPVECYPGQINQVFMNILSNAIDAIDGEGRITIATSKESDRVVVAISDTGTGIPGEQIDRVFDPFFTTKDVGKGAGLGLAICQRIVREHGGEITAESVEGMGSTFSLGLPLAPSSDHHS